MEKTKCKEIHTELLRQFNAGSVSALEKIINLIENNLEHYPKYKKEMNKEKCQKRKELQKED